MYFSLVFQTNVVRLKMGLIFHIILVLFVCVVCGLSSNVPEEQEETFRFISSLKPKPFKKPSESIKQQVDADVVPSLNVGRGKVQKCGTTLKLKVGDYGMIQSPNYPYGYPPNLDCEWSLEAERGTFIQATFFDIRISPPNQNSKQKFQDSLQVTLNGKWGLNNQRFSGNMNSMTPFNLISFAHKLSLRLRTTPSSFGGPGFKLGYNVIRKKPSGANELPAYDTCDISPIKLTKETDSVPPAESDQEEEVVEQLQEMQGIKRSNVNPHLVALILDGEYFCSGVLIRQDLVMTTAHCTQGVKKIDMIFGTQDLTEDDAGVQKRNVQSKDVHQHPHFDNSTGSHDLSVIKLAQPVEFTRFVKAARIPSASSLGLFFDQLKADVSGWGDNHEISPWSRRRRLLIASNSVCRSLVHSNLNGLMMCSLGDDKTSSCQVDPGSPLTSRCYPNTIISQKPSPSNPANDAEYEDDPDYESEEEEEEEEEEVCYEDDPDCDILYDVPDDKRPPPEAIPPSTQFDGLEPCTETSCDGTEDENLNKDCVVGHPDYPNCHSLFYDGGGSSIGNQRVLDWVNKLALKNNVEDKEDYCYLYRRLAGTRKAGLLSSTTENEVERARIKRESQPLPACPKFGAKIKSRGWFRENPEKAREFCDGLTFSDVLVGLVSFGSCQDGLVFTRMTGNMDFVSDVMNSF